MTTNVIMTSRTFYCSRRGTSRGGSCGVVGSAVAPEP